MTASGDSIASDANRWKHIKFYSGSSGDFYQTVIRYGGLAYGTGYTMANVANSGGEVNFDVSTISHSYKYAYLNSSGDTEATSTVFGDSNYGVAQTGGAVALDDCVIRDTSKPSSLDTRGLYASGGTLTVTDTDFMDNVVTAEVNNAVSFTHSGNSVSGGLRQGIFAPGNITSNRTWVDDLPYIVPSVTVSSGVTLTLNPGVVLSMDGNGRFNVYGDFVSAGTVANPVVITSLSDNFGGYDFNGDGTATSGAAGQWETIKFFSGSEGDLDYTEIRFGGYGSDYAGVYNYGGDIDLDDCDLRTFSNYGLRQSAGAAYAVGTDVGTAPYAVHMTGGTMTFAGDSAIHGGSTRGLYASGGTLYVYDTAFTDCLVAGEVTSSVDFHHSGNSVSGGPRQGFFVPGNISGAVTWPADLPYIVPDIDVTSSGSLTVEAGAVLTMDGNGRIEVYGDLMTSGTSQDPVVVTSLYDNFGGYDVNGDGAATSGSGGQWYSLKFFSGSTGDLNHTEIRYGGYSNSYMVYNGGSSGLALDNCVLSESDYYGLYHSSGTTNAVGTIFENQSYGAYVAGGT
ncbi:MAG: hypothetical protein V1738_01810, partial [Patescibacteria group bacterium]